MFDSKNVFTRKPRKFLNLEFLLRKSQKFFVSVPTRIIQPKFGLSWAIAFGVCQRNCFEISQFLGFLPLVHWYYKIHYKYLNFSKVLLIFRKERELIKKRLWTWIIVQPNFTKESENPNNLLHTRRIVFKMDIMIYVNLYFTWYHLNLRINSI